MMRIDLTIQLHIEGPLLSQSSEPGEPGHDRVIARNEKGIPYLPGSLITGKLNQAWQEIRDAVGGHSTWFKPQLEQWLGEEQINISPRAKQLLFTDFVLQFPQHDRIKIRNRIAIDKERGAVDKHRNFIIEAPFDAKQIYTFSGELIFFTPAAQVENIIRHVKVGLRWLDQAGAQRSVGFGRIVHVEFSERRTPIQELKTSNLSGIRIGLKITPHQAFCIARKIKAYNLFESESVIPGGALLGCIATTWSHLAGKSTGKLSSVVDPTREILLENFNLLRVTHAFPSAVPLQRPVVAPLSLVKITKPGKTRDDRDIKRYDVALVDKPCLIDNQVPCFSIDWKDHSDVSMDYGWPHIQKVLRVRTAIQPENLRSADRELFAYEQVVPGDLGWYAELDLMRVPEHCRRQVLIELQSLVQHGIIGLGKTKATADIDFVAVDGPPIQPKLASNLEPLAGNQWVVTLQSDTLLGSPEQLDESSGEKELQCMYQDAWRNLSSGKLALLRYFARQKLAGSKFQRNRFQKGPYKPYLLTEAGSVFVLAAANGNPDDCKNRIEEWLNHGLPICENACSWYGIDTNHKEQWRTCPYLPQNGYGEIAVNLPEHGKALPEIQPIDMMTEIEER